MPYSSSLYSRIIISRIETYHHCSLNFCTEFMFIELLVESFDLNHMAASKNFVDLLICSDS